MLLGNNHVTANPSMPKWLDRSSMTSASACTIGAVPRLRTPFPKPSWMAAIVPCGRQAGSSILSRAAACAWTFVNQPHAQLSHLHDGQLHASAPGTHARSNEQADCLSESVEAWPSMPDFMWMGKGDKRTFRGKVRTITSSSCFMNVCHYQNFASKNLLLMLVLLCSSSVVAMAR